MKRQRYHTKMTDTVLIYNPKKDSKVYSDFQYIWKVLWRLSVLYDVMYSPVSTEFLKYTAALPFNSQNRPKYARFRSVQAG